MGVLKVVEVSEVRRWWWEEAIAAWSGRGDGEQSAGFGDVAVWELWVCQGFIRRARNTFSIYQSFEKKVARKLAGSDNYRSISPSSRATCGILPFPSLPSCILICTPKTTEV